MVEIVATNVVASQPPNGDRLQRRRSCQLVMVRHRAWKVVYLPGNTGPNFLAKCVILQTDFGKKNCFCCFIYQNWSKLNQKHNYCFFFILKSYLYLLSPSFGSFSIGLSKYLLGFSDQIGLNFLVSAYLPGNAIPAFPILFRPCSPLWEL